MYQLKKIDPIGVAKYSFLLILIVTFSFFLLVLLFVTSFTPEGMFAEESPFPMSSPFFFILFLPFVYAFFGALVNSLLTVLYNILAARLGGIKIELESETATTETSPSPPLSNS